MEYVTVAQEGFYGLYHVPVKDHDPKKVVIVVGGSEGNDNIPMNVGAMFARCGIAALGICYWNVDGLPKELVRVPVDPFEKAILWLKNKGYEKASHILVPLNPSKLKMFKIERQYPEDCRRSREDAFHKTIKWISEVK